MIDSDHPSISVNRQLQLLSVSKGGYYYQPVKANRVNLKLMNSIDTQYLETPFYGSRRMTAHLNSPGYKINRKRVSRLMGIMGIKAIYPGPNLSKRRHEHKVYPYLLNTYDITQPNRVWSADITYIRINGGFIYLTAVIDWHSRYVLSWKVSSSLENSFCIEALEDALIQGKPFIFNTDQGVQYTAESFIKVLKTNKIKISMDSKGRAFDNIFVERLWRSVKYEEVYIEDYPTVGEARRSLGDYFNFYNEKRFHQSLDYKTPVQVHFS